MLTIARVNLSFAKSSFNYYLRCQKNESHPFSCFL